MAVSYTSQTPQVASPYQAFYPIKSTDFGVLAPGTQGGGEGTYGNGNLAYNAGAGSLAMSTAHCKITYITAQGESLPSSDASVSIAAGTGAFTVTLPTSIQTAGTSEAGAAPILGWRVYSASTTSTLLNAAANSTTQVQQNFTTTAGVLAGFPIATTAVQVLIYGAGAAVPAINQSGLQPALPSVAANTTADIFCLVSRNLKALRNLQWDRIGSASDPAAIVIGSMDVVAPVWPASTAINHYQGASVNAASFMVLNGYLFACTVAGTTGSSIPAALALSPFGNAAYLLNATTADNSATWSCLGPRSLVKIRFGNTSATAGQPVSQEYDLFQI